MEKMTFETAIEELEKVVAKMEKGQLELEESLKLYEQGVGLARFCQKELNGAKLKIEQIAKNGKSDKNDSAPAQETSHD